MTTEALPVATTAEPNNQSSTKVEKPITDRKPEKETFSPSVSGDKGCSGCPRDYNI